LKRELSRSLLAISKKHHSDELNPTVDLELLPVELIVQQAHSRNPQYRSYYHRSPPNPPPILNPAFEFTLEVLVTNIWRNYGVEPESVDFR